MKFFTESFVLKFVWSLAFFWLFFSTLTFIKSEYFKSDRPNQYVIGNTYDVNGHECLLRNMEMENFLGHTRAALSFGECD